MLREGDERAKALLLLALLDMQQSKPMRVNMKESEELEPMRKIDEIRRFSNKELRLTKEFMGALPKSSEYWTDQEEVVQLRIRNHRDSVQPFPECCFFDYEQAVLLRLLLRLRAY